MHRVIFILVEASDEDTALKRAQRAFDRHLSVYGDTRIDGARYDYCTPMSKTDSDFSGGGRWSQYEGVKAWPIFARPDVVRDAMTWLDNHFAENLYGFIQGAAEHFEEENIDPEHLVTIVREILDTREDHSWHSGGELLMEEFGGVINKWRSDIMGRYYAAELKMGHPMVSHLFDDYSTDDEFHVVDSQWSEERIEELLIERPDDCWVVPLDVHS